MILPTTRLSKLEAEVEYLKGKVSHESNMLYSIRQSIREANKQTNSEMLEVVNRFVNSEEFLDKIIARIRNKQL